MALSHIISIGALLDWLKQIFRVETNERIQGISNKIKFDKTNGSVLSNFILCSSKLNPEGPENEKTVEP